ncbi:MAG: hypothetical protein KC457_01790 [Myxococcales bacterium]|nr:hypothetical protein [Myxococcales bacterium]
MPLRPQAQLLALVGLSTGLLACGEAPSYQIGWRIADADGITNPDTVSELRTVKQCSEVGLSLIEVTALAGDGSVAHVSRFPCFPSPFADGDLVDGPTLAPGDYTLSITGLRRSGEVWDCTPDPNADPDIDPLCIAQASAQVSIAEGQLPAVEVVLLAPPQCDDGIDNDNDGRVDRQDRACQLDPEGNEDGDRGAVIFQLTTTMLDSQVVLPVNVRINYLQISVDGEEVYRASDSADLDLRLWPYRVPLFSLSLEPGPHTLEVTALGGSGIADDPLTQTLSRDFVVDIEQGAYVVEQFDFGIDTFLQPIEDGFYLYLGQLPYPGAEEKHTLTCQLLDGSTVEGLRLRVLDEDQQPLDALTLGFDTLGGVDGAQGWIDMPCQTSNFGSNDLPWGGYSLEAQGLRNGEVCFDQVYNGRIGPLDGPAPLAPQGDGGAQRLFMQRVVDDQDMPPAACVECQEADDCSTHKCNNGLCVH